ncbi:MAG: hypothetical protein AB1896_14835 [Thermodesulfobacteriota bacterium]
MRQVLLDELSRSDVDKVHEYLKSHAIPSSLAGLYWVELAADRLDPDQYGAGSDRPFRFAVEVGDSWARFELLVRSRDNLRSPHTRYANREQRRFILDFTERLITNLGLKT